MKKLFLMLMVLSFPAYSDDRYESYPEKAPPALRGGEVEVKLPDGTIYGFSSDNYKVVPRGKRCKICYPELRTELKTEYKLVSLKNRMSVLAGYGPSGLYSEERLNETIVRPEMAVLFGVRYQRFFYDSFDVGIEVLTNRTAMGSFGYGW